ncbi:MAG: glycosyltransferase family 39 protein [Planctomycetes bacterium]|nr:glycosyltransferase family 39 protein [Planctomycetota bacterium]
MSHVAPRSTPGWLSPRRSIAIILFAAALLRLPALDSAPPPLNQDEASRLYDAWSLFDTGKDRTSRTWPFFLESYGEGDFTAALTTYLTIPFVAILGPTTLAVRLPDALLSVVTVALVWDWLRRAHSERLALMAALFLALDPWHVLVTRTGWEFGYVPFFLTAGLYAAERAGLLPGAAKWRGSTRWAVVSATMLAFCAWAYPSTRMVVPLLCVALVICNWCFYKELWINSSSGTSRLATGLAPQCSDWGTRRACVAFVASAIIAGAPLWITMLRQPERLAARAKIAMLDFSAAALPASIPRAIGYYLSYFNPILLVTHPEEITTVGIPGVGMHLWVVAPLIVIGVFVVARRSRTDPLSRTLLLWLVLTPLPAAICDDIQPHMIRVITAMTLWPILGAVGADWMCERMKVWRLSSTRAARLAFGVLFAANAAWFAHQYFRVYPAHAELGYQTPLIRALEYVAARRNEADFVLVTNRANQAYIYALLAEPIPPKELHAEPPLVAHGPVNFHQVIRVGRYLFTPRDPLNYPDAQQLFRQAWDSLPHGARGFVIEQPGYFPEGELITHFPWAEPTNSPGGYEVRRWRKD